MAYSELILRDGEDLVLDLHPHWWFFAKSLIATVAAVIFGLVVVASGAPDAIRYLAAVLIIGTVVWFGERYIRWASTYLILTSDRVVWREGIIAKHGIEIPLQRINTIFFSQRIFERVLGLGDLKIESASETGAQIFDDIRNPDTVQHEIYSQMEANENRGLDKLGAQITGQGLGRPAPVDPSPRSGTVAEQIADLHRLHEQGALTDAEYQAKKAELLGRM